MIRQWVHALLWAGITATVEISIMWPLPLLAYHLNVGFVSAAILAFLLPWPRSLWYGLFIGVTIDWFSPLPFGTYLIMCGMIVSLVTWLQQTWLKQMSILSVFVISLIALSVITFLFGVWVLCLLQLGWLAMNWLGSDPWWVWIVGLLLECTSIGIVIRLTSRSYGKLF